MINENRENPLVASIVIDSYNYGHYLRKAIDSALAQTYPHTEVIVVDDGSTDDSKEIILSYGEKIQTLLKENGGQPSAVNAGVEMAKGDVIFFLDSDDVFHHDKVEKMMGLYEKLLAEEKRVFIYHRLNMVSSDGEFLRVKPKNLRDLNRSKLSGELVKIHSPDEVYDHIEKYGYLPFRMSPTSGLSISRELAEIAFPIPEAVPIWPDNYFGKAAMIAGHVYGIDDILGDLVHHGDNWSKKTKKSTLYLQDHIDSRIEYTNRILEKVGKKPIISFYDSLYAASYYEKFRRPGAMLALSFKVPWRHLSGRTLVFALENAVGAVKLLFRKLLGR